jgi:hypothetical protein
MATGSMMLDDFVDYSAACITDDRTSFIRLQHLENTEPVVLKADSGECS